MTKKKILPTELQLIVDDIRKKQQKEDYQEVQELIDNVRLERSNDKSYWDVPINQEITCFDPTLSYEITGYRPIDETHSLDFNPDWFTEVREVFKRTGKYCSYLPRSKRWDAFWKEQYKRCKYGMTSHGYTITGDNYFFLNFYQLPVIDQNEAAGSGTEDNFPNFMASQYMFFHYLQMCRVLRRNACLMKARSIGFSEIMASIAARMYTAIKKSRTLITCFKDVYLKGTFSKVDHALTFLNMNADGFFKPRLKDTTLEIKSGFQVKKDGQFVDDGWQSVVKGILADKPSKIRGDRVDLLIYDEAGCHIAGTKVLMFDGSTKNVEDLQLGDKLMGPDGTERNVIELHSGKDQMYKLIMDNKEEQIVNYVTINNSLILKWKEIKNLASLTKTVPSERNLYQIVDIVFTVIYISRLFNGDFDTNSEILEYIFQLCPLLYTNKDTLPFDITSSINYIVDKMKIIEGNNLKRTKNLLISDMLILLKGMKGFIFESFIRLYDIIHFCSLEQGIKKRIVQRCTLSKNKLIYFMSYLKSNVTNEMINQLIVDIKKKKKEQSI